MKIRNGYKIRPPSTLAVLLSLLSMLAFSSCSDGKRNVKFSSRTASSVVRDDTKVDLEYVANTRGDMTVEVVADLDGLFSTTDDQVRIASALPVRNGVTEVVTWDTTLALPGTYRVFAVFDNGTRQWVREVVASVELNAPPTVRITSPLDGFVAREGGVVAVTFVAEDPDDVAVTTLYADADGNLATLDDRYEIGVFAGSDGTPATLSWDTRGVPTGSYRLLASIEDALPGTFLDEAPEPVELMPLYMRQLGSMSTGATMAAGRAAATLGDGGGYVAGFFQDSLTLDGATVVMGPGVKPGDRDLFLVRFDANGDPSWLRASHTTSGIMGFPAEPEALAVLPHDGVAVAGSYRGFKTFGAVDLVSAHAYPAEEKHTEDAFVAAYRADGSMAWAASAGGPGVDRATAVVGWPDGSVVVGGTFSQGMLLGQGQPGQVMLPGAGLFLGTRDLFLARYDPAGTLLWAQRLGGVQDDELSALIALDTHTLLAAGSFRGTAGFGTAPSGRSLVSAGEEDGFVTAWAVDGSLRWAMPIAGADPVSVLALAPLADGGFAAGGVASGDVDFGAGPVAGFWNDPFLVRYAGPGHPLWTVRVETSGGGEIHAVAAAPDGGLVVGGSFEGLADFGGIRLNAWNRPGDSRPDGFYARYGPDGTLDWARAVGGVEDDAGLSLAAWGDCTLLATGRVSGYARFRLGHERMEASCYGEQDCFVLTLEAQPFLREDPGGAAFWVGDLDLPVVRWP